MVPRCGPPLPQTPLAPPAKVCETGNCSVSYTTNLLGSGIMRNTKKNLVELATGIKNDEEGHWHCLASKKGWILFL